MRTVFRYFWNGSIIHDNRRLAKRGFYCMGFLERIMSGGTTVHTKTMEGLAGASTNMKLLNTPFRVYKDAERRGDTAVMERAMGYVGDFAEKAEWFRYRD